MNRPHNDYMQYIGSFWVKNPPFMTHPEEILHLYSIPPGTGSDSIVINIRREGSVRDTAQMFSSLSAVEALGGLETFLSRDVGGFGLHPKGQKKISKEPQLIPPPAF